MPFTQPLNSQMFSLPLRTLHYSSSESPLLLCAGYQQPPSGCWALGKNNFFFHFPPLIIIRVRNISPQRLNLPAPSVYLAPSFSSPVLRALAQRKQRKWGKLEEEEEANQQNGTTLCFGVNQIIIIFSTASRPKFSFSLFYLKHIGSPPATPSPPHLQETVFIVSLVVFLFEKIKSGNIKHTRIHQASLEGE